MKQFQNSSIVTVQVLVIRLTINILYTKSAVDKVFKMYIFPACRWLVIAATTSTITLLELLQETFNIGIKYFKYFIVLICSSAVIASLGN